MTCIEQKAWAVLLALGASKTMLGDKHALNLSSAEIRSAEELRWYCRALAELIKYRVSRELVAADAGEDPEAQ